MSKVLVCLFVAFSLLLTPVAHAVGVEGDECHSESIATKDGAHNQNANLQNDGEHADTAHHCCCIPASLMTDALVHVFVPAVSKSFLAITEDNMTSVVVGPLLEPPSHV